MSRKKPDFAGIQGPIVLLALLVVWLVVCQVIFFRIQESASINIERSIWAQLRENSSPNSIEFFARNLNDLEELHLIRCVSAKQATSPLPVLDTTFRGNCSPEWWRLNGAVRHNILKTINGDLWEIRFISNNSPVFFVALWAFRLVGFFVLGSFFLFFNLKLRTQRLLYSFELAAAKQMKKIARQVAHDIRSPITAIRSAIRPGSALTDEGSQLIDRAAKRMEEIANDLLARDWTNFSKSGTETKVDSSNMTDMKNLIQTIVEEKKIRENNEDKNIRFICNLTGNDSIVVKADMTRLGRVISNLLNNSIESIAESGWIEISLTPAGQNAIRLDVKDSGIGIDHGLLEKLLSGEAITTKGTQGHGLGLSSSIAFIRNDCKGQFDIRSKKNAGTWVSILLPTF